MQQFTVHSGTAVPLRRSNVDTDQIIPARFCTHSSRDGHADSLFADWRESPEFVLNLPEHQGATVLVTGNDFGTGSSREYAVWALQNYGFRVVIAPRFGDIFRDNALLNGLLAITADIAVIEQLWDLIASDPTVEITVDLQRCEIRCADLVQPFPLDPDARARLLAGADLIATTLSHESDIADYERTRRAALPITV